jgi:hypothetical protein
MPSPPEGRPHAPLVPAVVPINQPELPVPGGLIPSTAFTCPRLCGICASARTPKRLGGEIQKTCLHDPPPMAARPRRNPIQCGRHARRNPTIPDISALWHVGRARTQPPRRVRESASQALAAHTLPCQRPETARPSWRPRAGDARLSSQRPCQATIHPASQRVIAKSAVVRMPRTSQSHRPSIRTLRGAPATRDCPGRSAGAAGGDAKGVIAE